MLFSAINSSYRQSMPWEYACSTEGREITTYIFQNSENDIAGVHYSLKHSPASIIKLADILHGCIFRHNPDPELLSFILNHFTKWACEKKACFIRFTPWLPRTISGEITEYAKWVPETILKNGYSQVAPGRHTYWIDLNLSEEELYFKIKKQTRWQIKRSVREGVEVIKIKTPSDNMFEDFWELYSRDHQEKRNYLLSKSRVKSNILPLMGSGLGTVYFAKYKGKLIYATLASNFGWATNIHSGMSACVSNGLCPSPGHLIEWEIIKDLKNNGIKIHDMGFCPGPVPIKNHRFYGIWRFKYYFGGSHIEFLPTFGKILRPVRGLIMKHYLSAT